MSANFELVWEFHFSCLFCSGVAMVPSPRFKSIAALILVVLAKYVTECIARITRRNEKHIIRDLALNLHFGLIGEPNCLVDLPAAVAIAIAVAEVVTVTLAVVEPAGPARAVRLVDTTRFILHDFHSGTSTCTTTNELAFGISAFC